MIDATFLFITGVTAFAFSAMITYFIIHALERKSLLDLPKTGSTHITARPKGGGLAPVLVIFSLLSACAYLWPVPLHFYGMLGGFAFLALVSWIDDLTELPANTRLFLHIVVIVPLALSLPHDFLIFQGYLPEWLDRTLIILAWVWFTNLVNFMDGIDGITGMEMSFIAFSVLIILSVTGTHHGLLMMAAAIIGSASLGFLIWNWQPARIFMGDVGAIPLGFINAWLLINFAAEGYIFCAILLPLYYCFDATATLLIRRISGRKVITRHRSFFFQRAIRGGYNHAQTVRMLLMVNICLLCAALVATTQTHPIIPWMALLFGGCCVLGITFHFIRLVPIKDDEI